MLILRDVIVAEARTWMHTRWRHQCHTKGLATDCGGMVGAIGIAIGSLSSDALLADFARLSGYGRRPANGVLETVCRKHLVSIDADKAKAGDVVLMRFGSEPQHMGILAPYPLGGLALIHAYAMSRKVVEHRLDDKWRDRVTEAFAFPGVEP